MPFSDSLNVGSIRHYSNFKTYINACLGDIEFPLVAKIHGSEERAIESAFDFENLP